MRDLATLITALDEPVDRKQVKTLSVRGQKLDYLPGWYIRAQLNRHFEHRWSWTVSAECVAERPSRDDKVQVVYRATGTLSVSLPDGQVVTRQGLGAAQGQGAWADAHELALKASETDALKRAASTFGPQFGLSLYDPSDRFGWDHAVAEPEQVAGVRLVATHTAEEARDEALARPEMDQPRAANMAALGATCTALAAATTISLDEIKRKVNATFAPRGGVRGLGAEQVDDLIEDLDRVAACVDPVGELDRYLASVAASIAANPR